MPMLEWILPDELIELILHPNESVSVWGYFFITILIIVIIGLVIAYYRKVK
jgi:hypothetical protein